MLKCKIKERYYKKHYLQTLEKSRCYDELTSLPNINYLKKLFNNDESDKYRQGVFLIIELDDIHMIRSTYGPDIAAEAVKKSGLMLIEGVSKDAVIFRGAKDEFIVLIPSLIDEDGLRAFCENIFSIFQKPIFLNKKNMYLDINIGASIYDYEGDSLLSTLEKADLALYKAKKQGNNNAVFYYKGLDKEVLRKIAICNNLKDALHKNEFQVYYQPQIDQRSSKVIKFEALLRWNNEELGNVSPAEFIPISEETGVIIDLGKWVIREVSRQIKEWISKGHNYVIAINISQKQFDNDNFIDTFVNIINEFNVPPNLIEIEVTETLFLSSYEANIKTLRYLRSMGIKIALDDFGTGYSSLSYLKMLPIDVVKIDKSFVDDIICDKVSRDLLRGIIDLMKKLQINIIVEGVETKEQADLLMKMECFIIQGYYYDKPLPANAIEEKYLAS